MMLLLFFRRTNLLLLWQKIKIKNHVFHAITKHIKIKYHFIKEVERENEVMLVHFNSEEQKADILTKNLLKARFETLRRMFGISRKMLRKSDEIMTRLSLKLYNILIPFALTNINLFYIWFLLFLMIFG